MTKMQSFGGGWFGSTLEARTRLALEQIGLVLSLKSPKRFQELFCLSVTIFVTFFIVIFSIFLGLMHCEIPSVLYIGKSGTITGTSL